MLPGWTYDFKHKGSLSAIVEVDAEDVFYPPRSHEGNKSKKEKKTV